MVCFSKVLKLYDSSTKESCDEILYQSPVWLLSTIWMFHGRVLNRKINHLHEPSLRIIYRGSMSSFHELFQKDFFFTIHHRSIKSLAIELYKINENLSNEIMSSISPP